MKTVVFYGSARRAGNTRALLDAFLAGASGEVREVDAYRTRNVSPCIDCRHCWKKRECAVKDGMQDIYGLIDEADVIVLASPMYFHCVSGPLKSILDRCQMYWAGAVRGDRPERPVKKGAILMVGGAPSFPGQFEAGRIVLAGLLGDLGAACSGIVVSSHTDADAVADNEGKKAEAFALAKSMYSDQQGG